MADAGFTRISARETGHTQRQAQCLANRASSSSGVQLGASSTLARNRSLSVTTRGANTGEGTCSTRAITIGTGRCKASLLVCALRREGVPYVLSGLYAVEVAIIRQRALSAAFTAGCSTISTRFSIRSFASPQNAVSMWICMSTRAATQRRPRWHTSPLQFYATDSRVVWSAVIAAAWQCSPKSKYAGPLTSAPRRA